jgi:hypothetical protein
MLMKGGGTMSIDNILFSCGCGKRCRKVEEARVHVDQTGHTMNVAGEINPSEHRVHIPRSVTVLAAQKSTSTSKKPTAHVHEQPEQAADFFDIDHRFDDLRARLGRK